MRRIDIWGDDFSPIDFASEFLEGVSVETIHGGKRASGKLGDTGMDSTVSSFFKSTAFPAFLEDEIAGSVTFHETGDERAANGLDGLDRAVADFAVQISLDERFSHGVLAEDQQTTCMYFWSPEGRWLVNMDLPENDNMSSLDLAIHREWAARTAQHFRRRVEELLERAGVWYGYRTLEWDWQTRRTEQHSFDRLASE